MMIWIVLALVVISLGCLGILAWYLWSRRYARSRFAFAGLAAITSLAVTAIMTLGGATTPWDAALAAFGYFVTGDFQPPSSSGEGLILAVFIIGIVAFVIVWLHRNWDGPVTEEQAERDKAHRHPNLAQEGIAELLRVVRAAPESPIHQPARWQDRGERLELPSEPVTFRDLVREAYCQRWPDTDIDPADGWHHRGSFWLGQDKRTSSKVALVCSGPELTPEKHDQILQYLVRLGGISSTTCSVHQIRRNESDPVLQVGDDWNFKSESLDHLLDDMVDFGEYRERIRAQVEDQALPNSDLTLLQTYTPTRINVEDQEGDSVLLPEFLYPWLVEHDQRHLALLGEYGQGKSTSALMLTYQLLQEHRARVPILLTLRGKSPRHTSTLEMLGAWGAEYNLSGRALMILHRAGRLLLILEGFDEMDGLGEQKARHAHFASLWRFASAEQAKILITGRPELFLDDDELRRNLGVHHDTATGPFTQLLHLCRFDVDQIAAALRSTSGPIRNDIIELAKNQPTFMDIVSRPSLLQQISTIWLSPELQHHKHNITSALVIKLFIDSAFRRQAEKARRDETFRFMRLNQAELSCFTTGVALFMAKENLPNQISGPDLHGAVERLLSVMPDDFELPPRPELGEPHGPLKERLRDVQDLLEAVVTNVRSYGILVRDYAGPDLFRFAHKSYFELLTAAHAADLLTRRSTKITALFQRASNSAVANFFVSPPSLRFCGELLATMKEWPSNDSEKLSTLYRSICISKFGRIIPMSTHLNACYLFHLMALNKIMKFTPIMILTILMAGSAYLVLNINTGLATTTTALVILVLSFILALVSSLYPIFITRLNDKKTKLLLYCQIGEAMVGRQVLSDFVGSTRWSLLSRFLEEPSPSS
jgi:hypothetical protein